MAKANAFLPGRNQQDTNNSEAGRCTGSGNANRNSTHSIPNKRSISMGGQLSGDLWFKLVMAINSA